MFRWCVHACTHARSDARTLRRTDARTHGAAHGMVWRLSFLQLLQCNATRCNAMQRNATQWSWFETAPHCANVSTTRSTYLLLVVRAAPVCTCTYTSTVFTDCPPIQLLSLGTGTAMSVTCTWAAVVTWAVLGVLGCARSRSCSSSLLSESLESVSLPLSLFPSPTGTPPSRVLCRPTPQPPSLLPSSSSSPPPIPSCWDKTPL